MVVMAADYPFMDVLVDDCPPSRHRWLGPKAAWVIFVVILPWLGVRGLSDRPARGMQERSVKQAQAQRREFDDYVRDTAGSGSAAEIAKAKELLDSGAITQEEFEALKAKALA
jgi:hypothetical protein